MISALARMTTKFKISDSGCWEWIGAKDASGYGLMWLNRRSARAHRVMFEAVNGPFPDGLIACHKCNNKSCINPDHIYAGTYSDNINDSWASGRKPHTKPMPMGEKSWAAKLKEHQVIEIYLAKETHRALGKKYGVSHSVIKCIKNNKTWVHITKNLKEAA